MNRILLAILFSLVALAAQAQDKMMRVGYEHHHKVYKDKSKERVDKYILHTDYRNSTFYNPSAYFLDKTAHNETARKASGRLDTAGVETGKAAPVRNGR